MYSLDESMNQNTKGAPKRKKINKNPAGKGIKKAWLNKFYPFID